MIIRILRWREKFVKYGEYDGSNESKIDNRWSKEYELQLVLWQKVVIYHDG